MTKNIPFSLLPLLVLSLAGCGSSNPPSRGDILANGGVPLGPVSSRAGVIYEAIIQSPNAADEMIYISVFEPRQIEAGKTVPLILEGHGYSGSRQTSDTSSGVGTAPIALIRDQGYGIISIDQRGHGESGGTIRSMDPDFEGRNLIAILDWAEQNLDWLAYGPDLDAGTVNPLIGAVGSSYGGGYQMLLHSIDPKKRLDVLVPEITWHDLTYSLFPHGVIKAGWVTVLSAAGNGAGGGGNVDPFITSTLVDGFVSNQITPEAYDFFRYHSPGYWCDGIPVATNGGPGTAPLRAPVHQTAIHALFFQGMRDTLFNFNEALANYNCLKSQGGDVRLLTYQSGHNTLQAVPDPGQAYQPPGSTTESLCGNVNYDQAMVAFFAEHLKGETGAIAAAGVPATPCLSLAGTDAVNVSSIATSKAGLSAFEIPATTVVAGAGINVPVAVELTTAGDAGEVFGGVPHATFTLADPSGLQPDADAIIFVGIGHQRAIMPGIWDLMDNQITPMRGLGEHDLDLVGVAERLEPGDSIALLIYGAHDQYHATGSLSAANPIVMPVSVSGAVSVPLLGPLPPVP